MAKTSGLGDNFYIGGYDLSGDVASIDKISGPVATLDSTGISKSANERLFGLRDASLQFTTLFNNTGTTATPTFPSSTVPVTNSNAWPVFVTITGGTLTQVFVNGVQVGTTAGTYVVPANGTISITYSVAPTWAWTGVLAEHNALSTLPTADEVASYFQGAAQGNAAACVNGKQINYDGTRDNKGALTAQVEVDGNGFGMEWGIQLTAGLRADTAATNGTGIDNGALTNFGAQAYFNLVAIIGTNVDIVVEHSVDNTTYTTLIDFGSQTAIGSGRGSVSNTTTVNRWVRVKTTGTFTYAQFAVMFNRNPIAGVVF
jgi:hypothetical protein